MRAIPLFERCVAPDMLGFTYLPAAWVAIPTTVAASGGTQVYRGNVSSRPTFHDKCIKSRSELWSGMGAWSASAPQRLGSWEFQGEMNQSGSSGDDWMGLTCL
jgi:hypothetical protein